MCKWRILRKYLIPTQTLTSHDLDLHHLFLCLLCIVSSLPRLPPSVFSLVSLSCRVSLSWDPGLHNRGAFLTHIYFLLSWALISYRPPFLPTCDSHPLPLFPSSLLISFLPSRVDLTSKKSCDETLFLSTSEPASTPPPM